MKFFVPVRTVAAWGGLHEWVLTAVGDLLSAGHEVTVAGSVGRFKDEVIASGASFIDVNWNTWKESVAGCVAAGPYDRVFGHGPLARNLGLRVSEATMAPFYHMLHGAYLDYIDAWSPLAERILAASPSIQDLAVRVGKVEPWKVQVIPNGAPEWVFDLPLIPEAEKLSKGTAVIATAARLAPDKIRQIKPTIELTRHLAALKPDIDFTLSIMGDGPSRDLFERRLSAGLGDVKNVEIEFLGWVPHEEVPRILNSAYAACAAGMGATRALAAGCLTVAAGAQGNVGVQVGRNLTAGLWSNFGDHGCPRFTPTPLEADLSRLTTPGAYDEIVLRAREACHFQRNDRHVRAALLDSLDLHMEYKK